MDALILTDETLKQKFKDCFSQAPSLMLDLSDEALFGEGGTSTGPFGWGGGVDWILREKAWVRARCKKCPLSRTSLLPKILE